MTLPVLALMLAVPLLLGGVTSVAGRALAHALAALAMLVILVAAVLVQPGKALAVGEATLVLSQIGRMELGFLAVVGLLVTTYHFLSGRTSLLPALLPPVVASIAAGCIFSGALLVAASFILLASLLTSLLMISEQDDWQASLAGAIYLILSALGGIALLFGFVLANIQRLSPGGLVTVPFVVAAISVGLALQWAVAPMHFWLPNAFQRAGPASVALAISVLGPANLGLLLQALTALPELVSDDRVNHYLTYGGIVTAVFGAMAALAPSKLRRTLGYVLVADVGYVLVGLSTNTRIGVSGAVLHLAHRSLVALLLVSAAAELEQDDRGLPGEQGAAPYMWLCLLAGTLAITGVPPFSGFAANWAIYQAAALEDWRLAILLAAASLVCLTGVLSALGRLLRDYPRPWRPPRPAERFLLGLASFVALWGLVPGPFLGAIHQALSQLPFLKPF